MVVMVMVVTIVVLVKEVVVVVTVVVVVMKVVIVVVVNRFLCGSGSEGQDQCGCEGGCGAHNWPLQKIP